MKAPFLAVVAASFCVLLVSGCASKSYAVLLDNPDGTTGAIIVDSPQGTTLLNQKRQGAALDGSSARPFDVPQERIQNDFSAAIAARPPLPQHFLIYFENGSVAMTRESAMSIPAVLDAIRVRSAVAVSIIGHADTVGREALNERLGLQRAQAIAALLRENGLNVLEMSVTSHGKRNLLVFTPDNVPEPRNRRVEINIR